VCGKVRPQHPAATTPGTWGGSCIDSLHKGGYAAQEQLRLAWRALRAGALLGLPALQSLEVSAAKSRVSKLETASAQAREGVDG
jgi:hypothetical protein